MLERVNDISWSSFSQPPWNGEGTVPSALVLLSNCTSKSEAVIAYHRVLYALGNNHAGTYYPVVLQALPFLGEIVQQGTPAAREGALDVLIDLIGSFCPEPGFEKIDTAGARSVDLEMSLLRAAQGLRPVLTSIEMTDQTSSRMGELARDLLELLDEETS